jgi:hypothetical protein|tara:strand:- start:1129 stop:1665 length:537 start_codon:yes stop_codon:yes gene_type:complete
MRGKIAREILKRSITQGNIRPQVSGSRLQEVDYSKIFPKGMPKEQALNLQKDMYEKAQNVAKAYGQDTSKPGLVSGLMDDMVRTGQGFAQSSEKIDILISQGMPKKDAIAVAAYYGSKTPRALKASKDLIKMGTSEAEMFGKKAVAEMEREIKRGAKLVMEDTFTGRYGLEDLFKDMV